MKKILSIALSVLMLVSLFALTGCGEDPAPQAPSTVKFGAAVYVTAPTATDATEDKAGAGKVDITIAAVTLDAEGKIVACALDTASNTVEYDIAGKAIAKTEFKTKYELGDNYNMVAYGGSKLEWYKQADAFEGVVVGKTATDVKALVAGENKGTDEVINAGCTIQIHEFVNAIEKACANAKAEVAADAAVKVAAATEQTTADATEDKAGSNKVSTNVFAAAVDAQGKILAASSDCVEVDFTFDTKGKSTFDATKAGKSKRELGNDYGMSAIGKQEWYVQADAFDAACVGKTSTEIAGLMGDDGKGVESLQTAGCTIYVTGFVKAASKI